MKYLHTINELNSMRNDEILKNLLNLVVFNVKYKSGLLFSEEKSIELKVWFTPKQIYKISDISTDKFFDKIPEIGFKIGDKIKVAMDWANKNNFEIIYIKRRHSY